MLHPPPASASLPLPAAAPAVARAAIVVLGDLAHSPRMALHATALAARGVAVELLGHHATDAPAGVRANPHVAVRELPRPPRLAGRRGRALWRGAAARAGDLGTRLASALVASRPQLVLVQVPPALPTLAAAAFAARATGARLVVDWHNLSPAMLALDLGAEHPAVALLRALEATLGRRADAHLCVSAPLRDHLAASYGVDAAVLPDLPSARFAPLAPAARRAWRAAHGLPVDGDLVVAPSSWSADEDLELLHAGLAAWASDADDAARAQPPLTVVASGRGPRREALAARWAARPLPGVELVVRWFDDADYPALLAAADAGVSLHRSASGLDLPMKLAEMRGAGLPAASLEDGVAGDATSPADTEGSRRFRDAASLARALRELLDGDREERERRRAAAVVAAGASPRWEDAWERVAAPVLRVAGRLPAAAGAAPAATDPGARDAPAAE